MKQNRFKVGDLVYMPDSSLGVVEVLEVDGCHLSTMEGGCHIGDQEFRFKDPVTGDDDWMHSNQFELVEPETQ